MTVLSPLRRLGVTVVAVAASATLVTACGSSTSGNPIKLDSNTSAASVPATTGGGSSVSVGGASTSAGAPVASASSITVGGGGGGGSKSAFCQQLQSLGSGIGSAGAGGDVKALADKFQKLADAAPAEIKPDLEKMASYLNGVANGKVPDASATEDYSAAAQRVVKYLTSACI